MGFWRLMTRGGVAVAGIVCAVNLASALSTPVARADMAELTPNWAGTWSSAGMQKPAAVTITSTNPLTGSIDIPGVCQATWSETARQSDTVRTVAAHVTSGPCADNTWTVTMSLTHLDGVDAANPGTAFSLMPNGIDPRTGQPASVEPTCAESLSLDQMPPGGEVALNQAGMLPDHFSEGMYGACALIDASGSPQPLAEPGVADGICKGVESFMDPLGLGYSKNVVCGTPAH